MNEMETQTELPEAVNPQNTQEFAKYIQEKSEQGIYRVEVKIDERTIPIDVYPTVFPPKSDYSASSRSVFETFGNLEGLEVAEIGSGSGIESIIASMAGAKHVDAADINLKAVDCSVHNVEQNGLSEKINVFHSDLLQSFPLKKYDLIIANLPIVNYNAGDNPINNALYDKDFELHKRLFDEAKSYLSKDGLITFTHANLQSAKTNNPDYDFNIIETLISDNYYQILERTEQEELGYKWVNYKIKRKSSLIKESNE